MFPDSAPPLYTGVRGHQAVPVRGKKDEGLWQKEGSDHLVSGPLNHEQIHPDLRKGQLLRIQGP